MTPMEKIRFRISPDIIDEQRIAHIANLVRITVHKYLREGTYTLEAQPNGRVEVVFWDRTHYNHFEALLLRQLAVSGTRMAVRTENPSTDPREHVTEPLLIKTNRSLSLA
jgi:hypothetical protein